jgi:hypothetical protein
MPARVFGPRLLLLIAVAAAAACQSGAPRPVGLAAPPSPVAPRTRWGVHLLLDDGVGQWPVEVWDQHLAAARALVGRGGYVVELVRADDLDVPKWQYFLDAAARRELTTILRLATWQETAARQWAAPPPDPDGQTYHGIAARFAGFVAALDSPAPLHVVVGNEPNRGDEWGGRPSPAEYARYLWDVTAALRAAAPGRVLVLNGALDQYAPNTAGRAPAGFQAYDAASFLDGMQAANPRVWEAIDAWASHAYPLGPFAAHPAEREFRIDGPDGQARDPGPPWPGLYNHGLNSYRWELFQLRRYGVRRDLAVFITETGWRHRQSQQASADDADAVLDADRAANFIRLAFGGDPFLEPYEYTWTPWDADRDVAAAVLFALGGNPSRWGHTNLVNLGPNGEVLGLKAPFRSLLKD